MKDPQIWATNYFIKAQDKKYIDWENEVINQIEYQEECTRSDAQGLTMMLDDYLTTAWKANLTPEETAKQILIKSTVN
jgi:hypothetical protein